MKQNEKRMKQIEKRMKQKKLKQNEKICNKFMFCPKKMFCSIQVVNSSCMIQRTRIFQHTYKKKCECATQKNFKCAINWCFPEKCRPFWLSQDDKL